MRTRSLSVGLLGLAAGCGILPTEPLSTVEFVDVQHYLGTWYEVASYPVFFEEGCHNTKADYSLRDDGRVGVVNTCNDGAFDGPQKRIEGSARIVDTSTNAKLAVTFFPPFEGDYWIIDLDPEYRWAVVGDPRRQTLFILSRTPALDAATYEGILSRLPEKGYDPEGLQLTPQEL